MLTGTALHEHDRRQRQHLRPDHRDHLPLPGRRHQRKRAYEEGADQTFTPHAVAGLSTEAATNLAPTSATLNASFVGDGEDTHYYFEWGTTTSYGNKTAVPPGEDAGSPMAPANSRSPSTSPASNLETTYHYRVVAENGFGTSIGNDRELSTTAAVAGLSTEAATNLAPTQRNPQRLLRRRRRRHPLLLRMGHDDILRQQDRRAAGRRRRLARGTQTNRSPSISPASNR